MSDAVNIWGKPDADETIMFVGWRQWADAGSISSLLPKYIIQQADAKKIGEVSPDGFYMFQIPGTHDLVRPVVQFHEGYPESIESKRNDLYHAKIGEHDVIIFSGDEPHMDVERYTDALLNAAEELNVTRIITFAGVYADVPYDKARTVSAIISHRRLRTMLKDYAVDFSNYHGGASIGSFLCRRAGDRDIEMIGMYALAPNYDFSQLAQTTNGFRVENDFTAWLDLMRRVKHMLSLDFDLSDLEQKSTELLVSVRDKVEEMDARYPDIGVKRYFERLSDEFDEVLFDPISDVWENELRRLLDDDES